MKQYLFLATAIATASLFTGCSNNEYVGDQPEAFNGTDGAIVFSMGKANTTRTDPIDGKTAAGKLNDVFYVYGEKYTETPETPETPKKDLVFNTYKVKYVENSSSASNTTGWEYVGNLWDGSNEKNNVGGKVDSQTIKYWDYSASKYTFYAFSAKPEDVKSVDPNIPNIKVSAIENTSPAPSYTVTIKKGASIGDLYFADKKEVNKNDNGYAGKGDKPAEKAVTLTFRNLAAKVRVGFYETVPGYSIKIDNMYDANIAASNSAFKAVCPNTEASQDSKIKVTYITANGATKNHAFVSEKKNANDNKDLSAGTTLTLGGEVFKGPLATTSSSPTWDTDGGKYTFFWPQEASNPLKITVDYTLTSTDGSLETIEVKGATATVPKEYVKWAANTAYTYIFKISDNTNGTTGDPSKDDPAGLYPITFDALVQDYANEGFITTVSTPSVTAKQDGTTNGYESVNGNGIVFKTGKPIDLKVMTEGGAVAEPAITGAYLANYDYKYNMTPEQNIKAAEAAGKVSVRVNILSLGQQSDPGYWVLKVATSSNLGAAFTYVIIRVGSAEEGPANPANQ